MLAKNAEHAHRAPTADASVRPARADPRHHPRDRRRRGLPRRHDHLHRRRGGRDPHGYLPAVRRSQQALHRARRPRGEPGAAPVRGRHRADRRGRSGRLRGELRGRPARRGRAPRHVATVPRAAAGRAARAARAPGRGADPRPRLHRQRAPGDRPRRARPRVHGAHRQRGRRRAAAAAPGQPAGGDDRAAARPRFEPVAGPQSGSRRPAVVVPRLYGALMPTDGIAAAKDLTVEEPRALGLEFDGYAHLPRMLDKARATLAGTAGSYLFGCPVDHTCMARLGVGPDLVLELAARHADDRAVLAALHDDEIPAARDAWFDAVAVEDELQEQGTYLRVRSGEELPEEGGGRLFAGADHGADVDVLLVERASGEGGGAPRATAAQVWVMQEGQATFFL